LNKRSSFTVQYHGL